MKQNCNGVPYCIDLYGVLSKIKFSRWFKWGNANQSYAYTELDFDEIVNETLFLTIEYYDVNDMFLVDVYVIL